MYPFLKYQALHHSIIENMIQELLSHIKVNSSCSSLITPVYLKRETVCQSPAISLYTFSGHTEELVG